MLGYLNFTTNKKAPEGALCRLSVVPNAGSAIVLLGWDCPEIPRHMEAGYGFPAERNYVINFVGYTSLGSKFDGL